MKAPRTLSLLLVLLMGLPAPALAQADGQPVTQSLLGLHDITVTHLMKTAEILDESLYAYRPTDQVRTAGQILAHVASAQFAFCSAAASQQNPAQENYEETTTTKATIVEALKTGFAYCADIYATMTDADGAQTRDFFGSPMAGAAILAFNSAHNYEHYGNLVTYMRLNGIVPPSSM